MVTKQELLQVLRGVYDPELKKNVVELGASFTAPGKYFTLFLVPTCWGERTVPTRQRPHPNGLGARRI